MTAVQVSGPPVEVPSCGPLRHGIVWLASYPKSGNTWFRIFLANLRSSSDEAVPLDEPGSPIGSNRGLFDRLAGLDSADMTRSEIDCLRPKVYEIVVRDADELPVFMKTHDAYSRLATGEPLHSDRATAGAIYFVRNPLDVAVSYSYHNGHNDFDLTISRMASFWDGFHQRSDRLASQLPQTMRGWSGHIESWLAANVPIHVMRYEDMRSDPSETFLGAVQFAGLATGGDEVDRALRYSQFDRLKEIERQSGFAERLAGCTAFFREGRVGAWRGHLKKRQVERVVEDHREMMEHLGYLDGDGTLLC